MKKLLIFALLLSTVSYAGTSKVSQLKTGEYLYLEFKSQGCFMTYNMLFNIYPDRIELTDMNSQIKHEQKIDNETKRQIDRTLKYYQKIYTKNLDQNCTTANHIRLIWQLKGNESEQKYYVDATCQIHKMAGYFDFHKFVYDNILKNRSKT